MSAQAGRRHSAPSAAALALLVLALGQLAAPAHANAFLDGRPEAADERRWPSAEQQTAILDELEKALGSAQRQATEARLSKVEEGLRPIYAALPKKHRGAVGAAAARYAMHRLFVQRHGWQVKGLEPEGEAWASSSPALALGDRVPGEVVDLFEARLGNHGFDLHELAVMAATLEHLIHGEAVGRVEATYRALGMAQGGAVTEAEAMHVLETYMASYILGRNISELTPQQVARQNASIQQAYPGWPETQKFLHEVKAEVAPTHSSFAFDEVMKVVEEVGERYGRWQSRECQDLKAVLVGLEEMNGTGRVHVADFYGSVVKQGHWQFSESIDYLRHLGAIDDSSPSELRVIIPNYINGPSNCVASSAYYSVCCIDECEGYMGHLERQIAAPSASVETILKHISSMLPAGTVSPALVRKLAEVADHHSGMVPLHGRLFAQWMHHAFPRECPYPHVSGTTLPKPAAKWEQATRLDATVTKDQIAQFVEDGKASRKARELELQQQAEAGLCSAMWTQEEELVDPEGHSAHHSRRSEASVRRSGFKAVLHGVALVAALAAAFGIAVRRIAPAAELVCGSASSDGKVKTQVYSV